MAITIITTTTTTIIVIIIISPAAARKPHVCPQSSVLAIETETETGGAFFPSSPGPKEP